MKSVCVFLGSSDRISPLIQDEAFRLGQGLAANGHKVIYGGAECGAMGRLAEGVLAKKGHLIGVIPEIDILTEVVQKDLSEKILVRNMADRKERMMEISEAFVVFPGGIGTIDELSEVMCAKALKSHLAQEKPIIFYNYLGFWTPFLESLDMMSQAKMISGPLDEMYQVFETLEEVLGYLSDSSNN